MSEQTPQPENTATGSATPSDPAQTGHAQGQTAGRDAPAGYGHISITQLTMAVLVIVFLWQWLDGHRAIGDMQQQLAKKIAEMDGNSKATQVLLAQDQDQVRELSAKVATMESRYAESQNQRVALENLYNNLSANSDEAALAEVEQMLMIASQQLQLSANVRAALIAMQTADSRLQRMNRPAFSGLRQTINNDMDKLRALHEADISGINLQLNNLISAVDSMPLAYQQQLPANQAAAQAASPEAGTTWQKLLHDIWNELKQLVRIENTDKAEIPLLPPNQEFFLRENLKLNLLSARLALLSRDEASFRLGLKTAQRWIARYFDSKSRVNKHVSEVLKKLAASDISIELPDISDSLQAVRNYRQMRESEPASFARRSSPPGAGSVKHPKASGADSAKRPKSPKADAEGSSKAAQ
jgi:uroporphyrin-3 C-methyltransferase